MSPVPPDAPWLGRWHIRATTLRFWRGKHGPVAVYTRGEDGRLTDRLEWTEGGRPKTLAGTETPTADGFRWRGVGWMALFTSDWRFVEVTESLAVTWFARATFGVTPEGMDIYSRTMDTDIEPVLARLRADPAWAHLAADWWVTLPPERDTSTS